ncbi:hypothetical protein [Hymenobacter psychrophilus]|uniref:Uncharacterized protein n=1 Tax=Hymenobacter psychrophilus TaxID=651662 RepID=A0A1H3EX28_9BACT|nr:hypothetical protein [Hymenobacter psychrophilus]SDX83155.1 hypothetical protein SAMN04488069_103337 [Hymenobacter psychrophilus]
MADKQPAPGDKEWEGIVQQLRLICEHVQHDGPLPAQEQVEAEDAFRQCLAHLENQVQDMRSGLKGSSGSF